MTIHETILEFLRDAQGRIAQLTAEIDDLYNVGDLETPKIKHQHRMELYMFMEILYEINWNFTENGYNHILSNTDPATYYGTWTEQDILDEIEYLRVHCDMVLMPFIFFTPYWTELFELNPDSGGVANLPAGTYRQMLMYNISNVLVPVDIDPYGGMKNGETINQYFEGRL